MRLVTAAVAGLLLGAFAIVPSAQADDPVPAPTVSVKVSAQGVTLPNSTMSAHWNGADRGHVGELIVDGHQLPATTTTIDALWTSKDFRTYAGIPALTFSALTTHQGVTSSSMPASLSFGLRFRAAGKSWQPWQDLSYAYSAGAVLDGYARKVDVFAPATPQHRVQVQWRMHTELSDVATEHQEWKLTANIAGETRTRACPAC